MSFALHVSGSVPAAVREKVESALLTSFHPSKFVPSADTARFPFHLRLEAHDAPLPNPNDAPYDFRFVWAPGSTVQEVISELRDFLDGRRFTSTRGATTDASFLRVVRDGLAPDGGLFNLTEISPMSASQLRYYCAASHLCYVEAAQFVLERLVDRTLPPQELHRLLVEAYDPSRWSGRTDCCPVTPLLMSSGNDKDDNSNNNNDDNNNGATLPYSGYRSKSGNGKHWGSEVMLLELYHGPTAAFKDFALQLFPRYFDLATVAQGMEEMEPTEPKSNEAHEASHSVRPSYMILAATSGDTGVAAISGFVNSGSSSRVMVLYPFRGVSPVQQMQMLAYDNGTSVRVYGAASDFDFCQQSVKDIFGDVALSEQLWKESHVRLSSANSINWGRLIPQVAYYFWAYRRLLEMRQIKFGTPLDVVVPCGNFGNILAAFFAKRMGIPFGTLVVASNQNDVLHEFIETGVYDIRQRQLTPTASPSIDILKASNVERLLFLLSNGNTAYVAAQMQRLAVEKYFEVEDDVLQQMRTNFWSSRCSEAQCAATIKDVYEASGQRRLLDPHTAVATYVARQYIKARYGNGAPRQPLLVVSTAHWAKFPEPVLHALRGEALTEKTSTLMDDAETPAKVCRALYNEILAMCPNATVHPSIHAALEASEKAVVTPRTVAADFSNVREEVIQFSKDVAEQQN